MIIEILLILAILYLAYQVIMIPIWAFGFWGTVFGILFGIPLFKKGFAATLIAVTSCLLLAFGAGGASGSGGLTIWPLFGSTNQILAGMTLLVISVMLIKLGRPAKYTMMPMVFVLFTSCWAAIIKLMEFWAAGNWLLVTIDIVVLVTSLLVILEAISVISAYRNENKPN